MRTPIRIVETTGGYVALCPFASRVPYEVWIMPRRHDASFERTVTAKSGNVAELSGILRRTLQRVIAISDSFHMVLHSVPNTYQKSNILQYWKTVDEDYHWHIEILPVVGTRAKPYFLKEVYYSSISSEAAAERLKTLRVR